MKAEFSEFSYGFAFTHSFIQGLKPEIKSAPSLPSLIDEGNKKGYDVALDFPGLPVFFQFKLSEWLKRPYAKYHPLYGGPYFRLSLPSRRHSQQHLLLRQLSQFEPDVYYVAPLFRELQQFNAAFLNDRVWWESIWLNLRSLPDVNDDDDHCVTYTGPHDPWWHSEEGLPLQGEFSAEQAMAHIKERVRDSGYRTINRQAVAMLRDLMIGIIRERHDPGLPEFRPAMDDPQVGLRDIHFLATTFFGVDLVILRGEG